jgi:hypothetical protein
MAVTNNGKGHERRPLSSHVTREDFWRNWEKVWPPKKSKEPRIKKDERNGGRQDG